MRSIWLSLQNNARGTRPTSGKDENKQSQPGTTQYRTGMGASTAGGDTLNYRPEMKLHPLRQGRQCNTVDGGTYATTSAPVDAYKLNLS